MVTPAGWAGGTLWRLRRAGLGARCGDWRAGLGARCGGSGGLGWGHAVVAPAGWAGGTLWWL